MSVQRLIEGLTTAEEVLAAIAPDPTERDRAVFEAARLFYQSWKPKTVADAPSMAGYVGLEKVRVKALVKSLMVSAMDTAMEDDTEGQSLKDLIENALTVAKSPEEFLFLLMMIMDFAGESGTTFTKHEDEE
jgi:hypothetical protein